MLRYDKMVAGGWLSTKTARVKELGEEGEDV